MAEVEYAIKCWRCKHLQHIPLQRRVLFVCRKTRKMIAQYDEDSEEVEHFCEHEPCRLELFEEVYFRCPICGKFYEYGSRCECGYDQEKIDKMFEALSKIGADFKDYLRFFVYLYDMKFLEKTEIGEMVKLAKKILLEGVKLEEGDSE